MTVPLDCCNFYEIRNGEGISSKRKRWDSLYERGKFRESMHGHKAKLPGESVIYILDV